MSRATFFTGLLPILLLSGSSIALQSCRAKPNPEVISRLEKILEIRELQLKEQAVLEELGRSDTAKMGAVQIATLDARIELAEEREDQNEVMDHLQEKIEVYQQLIQRIEAMSAEGLSTLEDLTPLRIGLLETEIRLLRLQES